MRKIYFEIFNSFLELKEGEEKTIELGTSGKIVLKFVEESFLLFYKRKNIDMKLYSYCVTNKAEIETQIFRVLYDFSGFYEQFARHFQKLKDFTLSEMRSSQYVKKGWCFSGSYICFF